MLSFKVLGWAKTGIPPLFIIRLRHSWYVSFLFVPFILSSASFKYLSNQIVNNKTTILKEYPLTYDYRNSSHVPYYAIFNEENFNLYNKYKEDVSKITNLYLCGRLAEYKYYNMDAVIRRALDLYEEIKGE